MPIIMKPTSTAAMIGARVGNTEFSLVCEESLADMTVYLYIV
uniref:Uncharacterized protein n=1 Tax=Ralstonia solanacearum TaxID=305 RepID=A0A0S4TZ34_RALSL|nr:protein of unknown function [Ralstonia solanacearum]